MSDEKKDTVPPETEAPASSSPPAVERNEEETLQQKAERLGYWGDGVLPPVTRVGMPGSYPGWGTSQHVRR